MRAITDKDVSNIRSLLAENAALATVADDRGQTPLHLGVVVSTVEVIEVILKAGGDPNVADAHGDLPVDVLVKGAITSDSVDKAALLIAHGASPDGKGESPTATLVMRLGSMGGGSAERGKDENNPAADLAIALMQHGADLDAVDNHGNTLLMTAIRENCPRIALELLRLGANAKAHNEYGQTAFHALALYSPARFQEIATLLAEKGCDISTRDKFGKTAIEIATARQKDGLTNALKSLGGA